jgi:HD-like signal output (HDOD) protein
MLLYALLPLVVSGGLAIRYVSMGDPSVVSKVAVVAAVGASLMVWWRYPERLVLAILLQVAVSLYVLIYLKVNPYAS